MDTYTLLRHFADSWVLLAMMLVFVGIVLWTLRPGSGASHRDTAEIPLRNDRLPESCSGRGATGAPRDDERDEKDSHGRDRPRARRRDRHRDDRP